MAQHDTSKPAAGSPGPSQHAEDTFDGPRLAILSKTRHVDTPGSGWRIVMVSDNATGIPEEHVDKLFSPFFTTKQGGKGTVSGSR